MKIERLKEKPFYLNDQQIDWVESTKSRLTTEEKVGQLFCLMPGLTETDMEHQMSYKPGGFMLRPTSTESAVDMVAFLNERANIPLLLAADLEKGGNGVSNDGTTIGSPLAVAATDDVQYASRLGTICAKEGAAVGLNWTFGPIVDIDRNPFNPITNVRTFGSNVERVKKMGVAYVRAAQEAKVAASCKHFPGDGVDFRDQHIVGSTNSLSVDEWNQTYGEIYSACIDAGTMTVMIGHIRQPAWTRKLNPNIKDEDIMPATVSPEIMNGLLREHLGFNGVIVTDATTMTGFMQAMPRPKLVQQVFASGADLLLFSTNLDADFQYVLDGVKSGVITQERLDEAVTRILGLKAALGLNNGARKADINEAKSVIGCEEHQQWARECAAKAITLVKEEKGVLPLNPKTQKRLLYIPLEGNPDKFAHNRIRSGASGILAEYMKKEGFDVTVLSTESEVFPYMRSYEYIKENFDVILYCTNFGTTSNQTVVRLTWPNNNMSWAPNFVHSIPTVFVSLESPYHLLDVPRVKTYINTYSPSDVTIEELAEKLMGRSPFTGTSPVDPFCGLWDAHL